MDKRSRSLRGYLFRPLALLVLIFGSFLLVSWHTTQKPQDISVEEQIVKDAPDFIKALKSGIKQGGLQRMRIQGVEVLLEIPEDVKGVLLVAHGCNHAATDFWPKGLRCEECLGLPEELNITARALARHYAVVGISSTNRHSGCWDIGNPMEPGSKDMENVYTVMKELNTSQVLGGLPQYALGASSGGTFVMIMGQYYPFAGIGVQIAALPAELLVPSPDFPYPATAFIHMPRDDNTAAAVEKAVERLQKLGVPVLEKKVTASAVNPDFLSRKMETAFQGDLVVGGSKSEALYKVLKPAVLDKDDMLISDPRGSDWRDAVKEIQVTVLGDMNLQSDKSPLAEVLNVAYASHEIVSDTTDEMLDWFEEVKREAEKNPRVKGGGQGHNVGGEEKAGEGKMGAKVESESESGDGATEQSGRRRLRRLGSGRV